MINKITSELESAELDRLIDHLPERQKIRLAKKLGREIWVKRMRRILRELDARAKKLPISEKEICKELEAVRKDVYGPRRR